uniref:Uncharacterized protein n=1 Tax=viral metagenome TaxID=1070528 RepID=A0A6M3LCV2_9ZZZZ
MHGFIDIEYETLKSAIKEIEKKKDTCKILPSARFIWNNGRICFEVIQVGNHMPNIGAPDSNAGVIFSLLVCDQLGGKSTGTSAGCCSNCKLIEEDVTK